MGVHAPIDVYLDELGREGKGKERFADVDIARLIERASEILERTEDVGIGVVTWDDPRYPSGLRHTSTSPPYLFYRGKVTTGEHKVVSLHTSGMTSSLVRKLIERETQQLVQNGWVATCSIGTETHRDILRSVCEAGGHTWVFVGHGLDVIDSMQKELVDKLVECGGVLWSPYPPGTPAASFRMRERLELQVGSAEVIGLFGADPKGEAMQAAKEGYVMGKPVYYYRVMLDWSQGIRQLYDRGIGFPLGEDQYFTHKLEGV